MNNEKDLNEYNKIESTLSKKEDLLEFLKDDKVAIFNNKDKDYTDLEDNDLILVVDNPYSDNTLGILLSNDFVLFFEKWHRHYDNNENDYENMKKDIRDIITEKISVLAVLSGGSCLGSVLYRNEISQCTDEVELLDKYFTNQEVREKIRRHGGVLTVTYWKFSNSFEFDLSSDTEQPTRKFPRRSNVRFVVENGVDIGSGSYKVYDENAVIMQYLYVEPSDKYDAKAIMVELYEKFEQDIIKDGFPNVFAICDSSDYKFFSDLNFVITDALDEEKLAYLFGSIVTHDYVVIKKLFEE